MHVRAAFAPDLDASVFVPIDPPVAMAFDLLWRHRRKSRALGVARRLRDREHRV